MSLCLGVKRPKPAQLEPSGRGPSVLTIAGMSKFALFLPLLLSAACGGSAPPAESAKAPEAEPETPAEAKPEEAKPEADEKPAASSKPSSKGDDDGPKPTRSPKDIVTAPDVTFMFSFNESDVKQAADTKCSASSKNDPKTMNECMAKARKAIEVDGYVFKEKDGKWWWLTLRTQGKTLHTLHKFEIEFGAEEARSIVIKPKGKDLGQAPGKTPGPITISVPNDYQIALNDAKLGKLVYEAKIGILSQ